MVLILASKYCLSESISQTLYFTGNELKNEQKWISTSIAVLFVLLWAFLCRQTTKLSMAEVSFVGYDFHVNVNIEYFLDNKYDVYSYSKPVPKD